MKQLKYLLLTVIHVQPKVDVGCIGHTVGKLENLLNPKGASIFLSRRPHNFADHSIPPFVFAQLSSPTVNTNHAVQTSSEGIQPTGNTPISLSLRFTYTYASSR